MSNNIVTRYAGPAKGATLNPNVNGGTLAGMSPISTGSLPSYGPRPISNIENVSDYAFTQAPFNSKVPLNAVMLGATQAVSSGLYATMTAGQYVLRGIGMTTQLAGIPTSILNTAAAEYQRDSFHPQRVARFYGLTGFAWSMASGFDYPTYTPTYVTGIAAIGPDDAALVTRAMPGQLVFRDGSPLPIQSGYKPKTN